MYLTGSPMCKTLGFLPSGIAGDSRTAELVVPEKLTIEKSGRGGAGEADLGVVAGTGVLAGMGVFVGSILNSDNE